eukprot:1195197-Prorocentrum_minimum.AAC.1
MDIGLLLKPKNRLESSDLQWGCSGDAADLWRARSANQSREGRPHIPAVRPRGAVPAGWQPCLRTAARTAASAHAARRQVTVLPQVQELPQVLPPVQRSGKPAHTEISTRSKSGPTFPYMRRRHASLALSLSASASGWRPRGGQGCLKQP